MTQELDIILRILLYEAEKAETLEEVRKAIRVMCSKDIIAAVEKEVRGE